jgi:hypothetical protein
MAPGVDWAEMICYRWDISGSMGIDCPCLGDLVLPSSCCVGVVNFSARALWAVVVQQRIRQSNEINNKSPMRVTFFVRRESDLSSFRTMIR